MSTVALSAGSEVVMRRSPESAGDAPDPGVKATSTRPISLRANLLWMLIARIVYNGCQWGVLATFATLGDPTAAGLFVLAIAVTGPIYMFANLQLRITQATDPPGESAFTDYRTLRFITTTIAMAAVLIIGLVADRNAETLYVILAIGLAKAIESVSDVYFGVLQRHEAIRSIATSLLVKGPLSVTVVWIVYQSTGSVAAASLGMAATWLTILLAYDIPTTSKLLKQSTDQLDLSSQFRDRVQRMGKIVRKALPLGVATGLLSLEINVPRYVVEVQFGRTALGLFGAVAYLMLVGQTIVQSMSFAIIPRLARHHQAGEMDAFCRILGCSALGGLAVGVLFVLGTVFGGQFVVELVYGPEYAASLSLLVIIAAAAGLQFVNFLLASGLRATRQFRALFLIQLVSLAAVSAACWFGGRQWGLPGVAGGIVAAGVANLLLLVAVLWPVFAQRTQSANQTKAASAKLPTAA